ncbi:hypothetical protein [Croceivirga radicis]|uniref:hypothetical protein n=1 Tax=Croceivirga radicis TaxID=1929488 RepID=UPI000255B21F|nr:hypothetical protein [Croceivirga radicis]
MEQKKVKGGALQFVLFIGVVITILLMAFLLLSHTQSLFKKKVDVYKTLVKTVNVGFLLNKEKDELNFKKYTADHGIKYTIIDSLWGVYPLKRVEAKKGKQRFRKSGLLGYYWENRPAVYLEDKNRPLVLAGDTKLVGDIFLPSRGIKRGNINGSSYNKELLVYGREYASDSVLPFMDNLLLEKLQQLALQKATLQGDFIEFEEGQKLTNSFYNPLKIISGENIELRSVSITGHIVIRASKQIVVHENAILKDVILIAPNITLNNNCHGNFQMFSNEKIKVGNNVSLNYPSSVVYVQNELKPLEPNLGIPIHIGNGTVINGSFFIDVSEKNKSDYLPEVKLIEGATLNGEIYCNGIVETWGRINGTAYVQGFVTMTGGSIYQNHLYNTEVNASNLADEFLGFSYNGNNDKRVVKWLY